MRDRIDPARTRAPICVAASNGGHLAQLLYVLEVCSGWGYTIVTAYEEHLETLAATGRVVFITDWGRNILKLVRNALEAFVFVVRTRPRVVVTTGAGTVVPLCYWAKLLGARLIYVETISRVTRPSLTGRLLHPIADRFFVQWPELVGKFRKAEFRGTLL